MSDSPYAEGWPRVLPTVGNGGQTKHERLVLLSDAERMRKAMVWAIADLAPTKDGDFRRQARHRLLTALDPECDE